MIHMLKPGPYWVGYILSIRGLFLPTVSWNLAEGTCLTVDGDPGEGRGCPWPLPRTRVFYLNTCLF